jgi:hypothetical protein
MTSAATSWRLWRSRSLASVRRCRARESRASLRLRDSDNSPPSHACRSSGQPCRRSQARLRSTRAILVALGASDIRESCPNCFDELMSLPNDALATGEDSGGLDLIKPLDKEIG